jgi:hypothetical protein
MTSPKFLALSILCLPNPHIFSHYLALSMIDATFSSQPNLVDDFALDVLLSIGFLGLGKFNNFLMM